MGGIVINANNFDKSVKTVLIDSNSQAARVFYRKILDYCLNAKYWSGGIITYDVKPDERYDPTLISRRVYNNSEEFLLIMAIAGISSFDEGIEQQQLVLPTMEVIRKIKIESGFESQDALRIKGKPKWVRYDE